MTKYGNVTEDNMKTSKEEAQKKAALFLRAVYEKCHTDWVRFNLTEEAKRLEVNHGYGTNLIKLGILKARRIGLKWEYKWEVGEPNLPMVKNVMNKANRSKKPTILIEKAGEVKSLSQKQFDRMVEKEVEKRLQKKGWQWPIVFRSPRKKI